jgi:cell division septation protein DedD
MASDDGFKEIQLSGKQLVFLFMATTIVAVVIFLCGVMVGRGVKSPNQAAGAASAAPAPPMPDAQPIADTSPAASPGTGAAQPASEPAGARTPDSAAKQPVPADEPPPAVPDEPPTTAEASPAAARAAVTGNEPAGDGWVVQVQALADKSACDKLAARLVGKGYAAYVTPPPPGGGVYRVRVGKFKERREADNVKRRLEKEEQLKPWITR